MWLIKLLTGGLFDTLTSAYKAKLRADTDEKKLEADMTIAAIEGQIQIVLAEQKRWLTAWIRPAVGLAVVIFVWKLLVWDYVLELGVSPPPSDAIWWIVTVVLGAHFVTRPFGK